MPFRDALVRGFWEYAEARSDVLEGLDGELGDKRPPVFTIENTDLNVIRAPDASQDEWARLLGLIPDANRHVWFRSMNSSQALAQSVFGNLIVRNQLEMLQGIETDSGEPLLGVPLESAELEYEIDYLGEPRRTSLDVVFHCAGGYRIAFECKLTESDIGSCSRPTLTPKDPNYEKDYCDGSYTCQRAREVRCSLTNIGVRYWKYIPTLFKWGATQDLNPCPMHKNYQLVRNVLAVCVEAEKGLAPSKGHVVLIYDERNPAFIPEGVGYAAYESTRAALHSASLLRKCSWQKIVAHLRNAKKTSWLADSLSDKYGF